MFDLNNGFNYLSTENNSGNILNLGNYFQYYSIIKILMIVGIILILIFMRSSIVKNVINKVFLEDEIYPEDHEYDFV